MDFVFFAQIYLTVTGMLSDFSSSLMTSVMGWVSAIAITLFTVWITIQGFRILTGQSRESMLGMVLSMSRTAVILIAASTMSIVGVDLQSFFNNTALPAINSLVTTGSVASSTTNVAQSIDQNLVYTQVAMAFIQGAEGLNSAQSGTNVASAAGTSLMAVAGLAGPPMTAGALLLTYQVALTLFVGLAPFFIMCLIFDQTKNLFQGWLMFGVGTMFSLAVLNVMVVIVLKITLAVAAAMWVSGGLASATGLGTSGLTSQAMQQGGIGMLMTALIISAPATAGRLFSAVAAEFRERSAFDGAQRAQPQQIPAPKPVGAGPSNDAPSRPNHSVPSQNNDRQATSDVMGTSNRL